MIAFNYHPTETAFWATELSAEMALPPAAPDSHFLIASPCSHSEVSRGDVIYGFVNGRLVLAAEVLEMTTPPASQAQLTLGTQKRRRAPCWVTTVRARTVPLRLAALIQQDRFAFDGESLSAVVERTLDAMRPKGIPLTGVAWRFDADLGQEMLLALGEQDRLLGLLEVDDL